MTFSFLYQWFPKSITSKGRTIIKDGQTLRPLLATTLIKDGVSLPFEAIVDSGSDKTISFEEIGIALGTNFLNEKFRVETEIKTGMPFEDEIFGLGKEPIRAFITLMDIEVTGHKQTVRMYWIREKFDPHSDFALVLGQDSIFSMFDIHFSKRQYKFFLNDQVFQPDSAQK